MKNTIIYLLGFPGTGKCTIAKNIAMRTRVRLIDNHLINNPVFDVVGADGKTELPEEISDYTSRIGDIVREAVVNLASPEENFILANEKPRDYEVYQKVVAEQ